MAARRPSRLDVLRRQRLVIATVSAVLLLGAVNWMQDPTQALRWLRTMLILPVVCLGMTLWYARTRRSTRPGSDALASERYFHAALTLCVVGVGIPQIARFGLQIWVRFGDHGADLEFERRIIGLATAAVFVFYGNALPKILTPLSMLPLRLAERVSIARRVVGPIWVVLGVAMTIAFIATPLALAQALQRWSVIAGMLTVLGAIAWMNASPVRGEP
jgi:hypothetical protein